MTSIAIIFANVIINIVIFLSFKISSAEMNTEAWKNNPHIQLFQEYLQIPSVHPNVDYEPCVKFLQKQAKLLNLPIRYFYPANPKKPIVVITWIGSEPHLPSIMLSSHMDVVPVYEENWKYPPFAAEISGDGKIYARGAQDMKSVGTQYLSAIQELKNAGMVFKRTIHITYVPDEEIGSDDGMKAFVLTDDFKSLNIGLFLDEGIADEDEAFQLFFAEKSSWKFFFEISGTPGHGSLLLKNTAGEKLQRILKYVMEFRQNEANKINENSNNTISNITVINLTTIKGGVQENVVPPKIIVGFDMRIAVGINHEELERKIQSWCKEAGDGIKLIFHEKSNDVPATPLDDTNPYWNTFKNVFQELGLKLKPVICPAATDSRPIRELGILAFGFSPMNKTPPLPHDHNEYIGVETYLKGIEIYKKLIPALANVC